MKKVAILMVLVSIAGLLFAGGKKETGPSQISRVEAGKYNEAPQLADLVARGMLPPLDERLPTNPLVVEPLESVGQYGGEWRLAMLGVHDTPIYGRKHDSEYLLRWNPQMTGVIPNIAHDWSIQQNGARFVFRLRAGMKWSDGEPFDADDYAFWYEDVLLNEEITPSIPDWLRSSSGEPVRFEKIDQYTIAFEFEQPTGLFPQFMAFASAGLQTPRHYLESYHIRYADAQELQRLVADQGYEAWFQLFMSKNSPSENPDRPTLGPWVMRNSVFDDVSRVVWERNPYFWKVDPEGRQLPYLDRVVYDVVGDSEVVNLRAMAGQIDLQERHVSPAQRPLYETNRERGDYRIFDVIQTAPNYASIAINATHDDPAKRAIFSQADFRIALSHAIDREEINSTVFFGLAQVHQVAPLPGTAYYHEELALGHTKYDPDYANQLLDRIGLTRRGEDGFRMNLEGEPLRIDIIMSTHRGGFGERVEMLEMATQYWADVGINARLVTMERTLFTQRTQHARDYDMAIWGGATAATDIILNPRFNAPMHGESLALPRYAQWYLTGGAAGEEPSGDAARTLEIWEQIKVTPDEDGQLALMAEMMQSNADNRWYIGITNHPPAFGIVKNGLVNWPDKFINSNTFRGMTPHNPETFWWRDPDRRR